MKLYIVGEVQEDNYLIWEFCGVFSTEEKAIAACVNDCQFIGLAILDEDYSEESGPWPEAYYPLLKEKNAQ